MVVTNLRLRLGRRGGASPGYYRASTESSRLSAKDAAESQAVHAEPIADGRRLLTTSLMSIIGIVAVDRNNAIGKDGKLPWHYSADLKFFKQQTVGNVCVMGRRTWLSLGKPLPERLNVILSRSLDIEPRESVIVLRDKVSVLSLKQYLACDLFIMGGAQIFQAFRDEIETWIVTEVPIEVEGADVFMPEDYLRGFKPCDERRLEEDLKVTFYERAG
jgi:dihydrofolate reductase